MIDITRTYQTRRGLPVRLLMTDGGSDRPVIGASQDDYGVWFEYAWHVDGSARADGIQNGLDLIEVPAVAQQRAA